MVTRSGISILVIVLALASGQPAFCQNNVSGEFTWPQWRGPLGTGEAPSSNPPARWSESQNIRWKVELPGHGSATPLVWGDRVYVTAAIPVGELGQPDGFFRGLTRRVFGTVGTTEMHQYVLLSIDSRDGDVVWKRVAREEAPHEGRHRTGSWASPSAVTDGTVLCAFFGSRGIYCYDMDGELLWDRDMGDMNIRRGFGEGASPALHDNTLVVLWDHEGQSFIAAFDKLSGAEHWRTDRDEMTSWATPLIVQHAGRAQIVTSGTNRVRSYDLETGRLMWDGPGVTLNAIPTPVSTNGLVYLTSGFRGNTIYAVDLDTARGDITGTTAVVWSHDKDTPYVPSPLLHDNIVYLVKSNSGILSAVNARNGRPHYGPERLSGIRSVYASPIAAGGHVYVVGREGTTAVIMAGTSFEVVAINKLNDGFDASPAVAGDEIYLRGQRYLYCIAVS